VKWWRKRNKSCWKRKRICSRNSN